MFPRSVCLMLAALLAPVPSTCLANSRDQPDLACLERVARELPGPVKPASIKPWPIKARKLRGKRLLFHRGDVFLVVDHTALHDEFVAFLEKHEASRFPEGPKLMRRFLKELESTGEAVIDDASMSRWERRLLDSRLAAVLKQGAFEIRSSTKRQAKAAGSPADTVIRLDWSYNCGDLCAGTGYTFITQDCQVLFSVTVVQS